MFDNSKIQSQIIGVVGCRQPHNPVYAILDTDNTSSRSGEWVTNNPYCKIQYLKDTQDYIELSDADFNTTLKNMQKDSISTVCHRVFDKPDYIDRDLLYKNPHNKVDVEELNSGLVGFRIRVSEGNDVAFAIKRIILDFEGEGDLTLMLFNSSSINPIQTQTVNINSTNQVVDLDWRVDNSSDTFKGDYFLGYRTNTTDIRTLKPFNRNYEFADRQSCISNLDIERSFYSGHSTDTLPDFTQREGLSQSIGLNPDILVYNDYTDFILRNEQLLARAVNLDMQVKFIEIYLASNRSSLEERGSKLAAMRLIQELNGSKEEVSGVKVTGVRPQLSGAIAHIRKEIEKLQKGYFGSPIKVMTLT
jgi:hypothetical protein